jgi:transposase
LASVVTDVTGVSARAMLEALVGGQTDVTALAALAQGRLRSKRQELEQALRGTLLEHHAFMIAQHLAHLDFLDEQIATFDRQIDAAIVAITSPPSPSAKDPGSLEEKEDGASAAPPSEPSAWATARTIGSRVAESIIAELGTDMTRFPSAEHAASWAKVAPGRQESGGKRRNSRTGKGNRYLKAALIQAAQAAVKKSETFLAAFYRRLATRRGKKKAIVAVAHKILVIVYTLLKTGECYQERGAAALDERQKDRLLQRLQRRIAQLGYTVSLEPNPVAAT